MIYSLKKITEISEATLAEFTGNNAPVTHAHNPSLIKVLHKTFGWKGSAYLILKDDKPAGYFPCMLVGDRIVSMPHFSHGGLITKSEDRKDIYENILPLIYQDLSGNKGEIKYLIREPFRSGNFSYDDKIISHIDINNSSVEEVIPSSQMNKAVKATENRLRCVIGGIELLNDFYDVYSQNMLYLGSPLLPQKLFINIIEGYENGDACIFCVYHEKKPVGAAFLMSFAGYFENTWFSTLRKYNELFPAQLLHYEMIKHAIENKGRIYSFGRSTKGSGVHEFKRRWGTSETVVYWNYERKFNGGIRKAKFLTSLWKAMPLWLSKKAGPVISKRIY